jgi:uncharacterized protein
MLILSRRELVKRGIAAAVIGIIASYPFYIERKIVQINHYQIPVNNLPENFEGFRIVHLTDLHFHSMESIDFYRSIINKANQLQGDIIVCTGDYVSKKNTVKEIDIIWPELVKLKAKHGVYSVLGNHDHWANLKRSNYWLNRSGQNLRHRTIKISKGKENIWLGGAGDLDEDFTRVNRLFNTTPKDACRIALAHNPDTADLKTKSRIDLFISGHTHGGQVKIPFLGTPIIPVKNKLYANGYHQTKKTAVFISRGIGWSMLPVRFNCYPEIAVLNLTKPQTLTAT